MKILLEEQQDLILEVWYPHAIPLMFLCQISQGKFLHRDHNWSQERQ
jgi:hypothetical protein